MGVLPLLCVLTFFSLAVPVRKKCAILDKHMEIARFQEEVELLEKEMMSFVNFYKSKVLPSLLQEQQRLENLLKGMSQIYVKYILCRCPGPAIRLM